MKLCHKTPCAECPWLKEAPAGWLGGFPPEMYADAVANGEVPACHLKDHGPTDVRTAFCVGALTVMANACIMPKEQFPGQEGARAAVETVGKSTETFLHHAAFYTHHTGNPWVHPLMRQKETAQ